MKLSMQQVADELHKLESAHPFGASPLSDAELEHMHSLYLDMIANLKDKSPAGNAVRYMLIDHAGHLKGKTGDRAPASARIVAAGDDYNAVVNVIGGPKLRPLYTAQHYGKASGKQVIATAVAPIKGAADEALKYAPVVLPYVIGAVVLYLALSNGIATGTRKALTS